jgi:hypothetical protein
MEKHILVLQIMSFGLFEHRSSSSLEAPTDPLQDHGPDGVPVVSYA